MRFYTLLKVLKQHIPGEEEGRRREEGGKKEGRRREEGGKKGGRRGEEGGKKGGRRGEGGEKEGGEWKAEGCILGVLLTLGRAAGSIFGTVEFGPRSGLDFGYC
jgi:hypothetical protein